MTEKVPIINIESLEKDHIYEYKHFENKKWRREIFMFTKRVIEVLENNPNSTILFFDRSARPAYVVIDEYWNLKHGDDELAKPKFYFINPKAFRKKYLDMNIKDFVQKNDEDIIDDFSNNFKNIKTDETIILLDTCIHSGRTIENVQDMLEKIGFKKILLIIADTNLNHTDLESETKSIKPILSNCGVFGCESLLEWDDKDVISKKKLRLKDGDFENSVTIRKELRQIIREGLGV